MQHEYTSQSDQYLTSEGFAGAYTFAVMYEMYYTMLILIQVFPVIKHILYCAEQGKPFFQMI